MHDYKNIYNYNKDIKNYNSLNILEGAVICAITINW